MKVLYCASEALPFAATGGLADVAGSLPAALRRRLIGRRFGQLLIAVINLILWIPFVYVTVGILKNTVSDLSTMLMMAVASGSLPSIDLAASVWPLVLTLAYAVCERKNASRKEAA